MSVNFYSLYVQDILFFQIKNINQQLQYFLFEYSFYYLKYALNDFF